MRHTLSRVAVAAAAVAAAAASFALPAAPARAPAAAPPAVPAPGVQAAAAASPAPLPVFVPERIRLPSIGVDAPVVPVGIEPDGAMGSPATAREVGWWEGVRPGEGNALFAGHRDWKRVPGSFFRLAELKPGDPVVVEGEGKALEFRVEWVTQMPGDAEAAQILGDVGRPVVTLITCGGRFDRRIRHYQERVVVRAAVA